MARQVQDYSQGNARVRVDALLIGQRVDLQNNRYADPEGYIAMATGIGESDHPEFEFDFQVVAEIEVETTDCIAVTFESGFMCGFPPDYLIDVDGEQDLDAEIAEDARVVNYYECPHCSKQWHNIGAAGETDDCHNCGEVDVKPYQTDDGNE